MNERIKELALQSQLVYETTDGKVYNSWEDYVDLTEYVEKFAELIVRECADIINHRANTCGDNLDSIKANKHVRNEQRECATTIKQHFGVVE